MLEQPDVELLSLRITVASPHETGPSRTCHVWNCIVSINLNGKGACKYNNGKLTLTDLQRTA